MNKKSIAKVLFVIVLIVIVGLTIQGYSLHPLALTSPVKPELTGKLAENELLSTTEWIDLEAGMARKTLRLINREIKSYGAKSAPLVN